ncbi:MAG TPA: hypothetical protein PK821_06335 [Victivallales bacterium]|nr:hypothetical protein [Victivallales bacterium]
MQVKRKSRDFKIEAKDYVLSYDHRRPFYLDASFSNGVGGEFFVPSGCDRDEMVDEIISLGAPSIEKKDAGLTISFKGKTTLWKQAEYIFECSEKQIIYYYKVSGVGSIDNARFFEGFEKDNPNTKDKFRPMFCGFGRGKDLSFARPVKFFSSGMIPRFETVYTTSINCADIRYIAYNEQNRMGFGNRMYCGGDWLVTPPPHIYLAGKRDKKSWMSFGLLVKPGEQNFLFYEYLGGEKVGLNLLYNGYTKVEGSWTSPKMLMQASSSEYEAIGKYCEHLFENGYAKKVSRTKKDVPRWWKEPIFGGWGEQMYLSDFWKRYWIEGGGGWGGAGAEMCTMEKYDAMLEKLEKKNVFPTLLIVDNRWFSKDCQLDVDESIWPDMKGWIKKQHDKGRRVILWIYMQGYRQDRAGKDVPLVEHLLNPSHGTPEVLEINTDVFYPDLKLEKRKIRVPQSYLKGVMNERMNINPLNESYRKRVEEKVKYLLSPEGLDADGFEFDYTHLIPTVPGFVRIDGGEKILCGCEYVHEILKIYYDAGKSVKKDALFITHTFNSYFNDVLDMLRLQDIYSDYADISGQMQHRTKIAKFACPDCVIHTDQHPMPSLYAWRKYAKFQPQLGNPCLYYVTGIESTHEKLTDDDFKMLRETWEAYHKKLDKEYGAGSRNPKLGKSK